MMIDYIYVGNSFKYYINFARYTEDVKTPLLLILTKNNKECLQT